MSEKIVLDINEAAFYEMNGLTAAFQKRSDGRILFSFEDTARLRELEEEYLNDARLQDFVYFLKRARGRMLEVRDGRWRAHNGNGGQRYADRTR